MRNGKRFWGGVVVLLAGLGIAGGLAVAQNSKPKSKPKPAAGKKSSVKAAERGGKLGEWPQFLGADRDNVSRETGLARSWPEGGPKLAWKASGLGAGYSAVSVAQGLVFTMGNSGDSEYLFALKLDGGEKVWEQKTGDAYHEGQGDGPRGTPAVDGDFVYALGANGDLVCCEIKAGEVAWRKNILQEFGGNNITWGISESPLVDGDRVLVTPGGTKATLVAYDKKSGKVLWTSLVPGGSTAGYASVVPMDVGAVRQYVQFVARGVMGVRASDGKPMWANDRSANGTANCSSAVHSGDVVFTSSGYGTGGAAVQLATRGKETQAKFLYHTREMESHHGGLVCLGEFVYGASDPGILRCLEIRTGKVRWQDRSVGKGAITAADGMLILRSENGPVALVEASPEGYKELGRFDPPKSGRASWPYPVVADGKLFLRDQDDLYVYDLK